MFSEEEKRESPSGGPRLEEIVPGKVVKVAERECYEARRLKDFWPGGEDFLSQYRYYLALGGARLRRAGAWSPEARISDLARYKGLISWTILL